MPLAWQRQYRLSVGPPSSTGRQWSELQITFEVKKDVGEEPNLSTISIYNLSEDSRGFISQEGQQVLLEAGYKDTRAIIFQGDLAQATHEYKAPDWITTLECGEGEVAYRDGFITLTRAPGATRRQVLEQVAVDLGLGLYVTEGDTSLDDPYLQGVTFHGTARDLLRRLARQGGREWSIQQSVLTLIHQGGATDIPAVLLSPQTGLIQTPQPTKKRIELIGGDSRPRRGTTKQNEAGVKITSLLNPEIRPGRLVVIEAQTLSGTFVCRSVTHKGDYRGNTWHTEAEVFDVARRAP